MDLVVKNNSIEELERKLIYRHDQIDFIKNFQELNEVYEQICNCNDLVITQISEILQSEVNEYERYRCNNFNEGKVSLIHCYEECQSTEDCYSEISMYTDDYYRRYLDSEIIAEIVLESLLDKGFVGVIELKGSPFAEAVLELYNKGNLRTIDNLDKNTKILINYPQSVMFPLLMPDDNSIVFYGSSNVAIVVDDSGGNNFETRLSLKTGDK